MPKYPGHVLREGANGPNVKTIQKALHVTADGAFGPITRRAVVRFQASHKPPLLADGEVGPVTWAALFDQPLPKPPAKNLRQRAFANAVELLGVQEVGGNNAGPMVSRIIKANGGAGPEPWCGDFAAFVYRLAGSDIVKAGPNRLWAYVPWMTRTNVTKTTDPKRGDLVRYDWNADRVQDHVGLFDRWIEPGKTFYAVEGNTGKDPNVSDSTAGGDGVHRRVRSIGLVSDFLHVNS